MLMAGLLLAALLLDEICAEVKRFHHLVGFGNYALFLERHLYADKPRWQLISGILCWCLAVMPMVLLSALFMWLISLLGSVWLYYVVSVIALYFTLGQKSLKQHGQAVARPLQEAAASTSEHKDEKLTEARYALSMIVSRDTQQSTPDQMATATIETITENTHDAIIGPLVFFVLLGVPGAVLFRLANTLDAMWGYRTPRYELFGKCAARIDDILGYAPARLTSILMALSNPVNFPKAMKSILFTGRRWYSPNAGLVMAAGAGALNIRLGGDAIYNGISKKRLMLGHDDDAESAQVSDIQRSIWLMYKTSLLCVLLVLILELFFPTLFATKQIGWLL